MLKLKWAAAAIMAAAALIAPTATYAQADAVEIAPAQLAEIPRTKRSFWAGPSPRRSA